MLKRFFVLAVAVLCAHIGDASGDPSGGVVIEPLSPEELSAAAGLLEKQKPTSAEIFYKPNFGLNMMENAPHFVERGSRCAISDHRNVAKLAGIVSQLRFRGAWQSPVLSSLEVRFKHRDRILFTGIFSMLKGNSSGHIAVAAMINERNAQVDAVQVSQLFDFARDHMVGPNAGRLCSEFEDKFSSSG